jgi:hypothetical protein
MPAYWPNVIQQRSPSTKRFYAPCGRCELWSADNLVRCFLSLRSGRKESWRPVAFVYESAIVSSAFATGFSTAQVGYFGPPMNFTTLCTVTSSS